MVCFLFCSNFDMEPQEIYLVYSSTGILSSATIHEDWRHQFCIARTDDYFSGWVFLNHISLLYDYGLLNALGSTGLNERYSVEAVLKLEANIDKIGAGGAKGYRVQLSRGRLVVS